MLSNRKKLDQHPRFAVAAGMGAMLIYLVKIFVSKTSYHAPEQFLLPCSSCQLFLESLTLCGGFSLAPIKPQCSWRGRWEVDLKPSKPIFGFV